jgi:hypothetical protein
MTATRATAVALLERKAAEADRKIQSAGRRSDKETAARLGGFYDMLRAELNALDWAQRRARG